jgi:hypothetical protein
MFKIKQKCQQDIFTVVGFNLKKWDLSQNLVPPVQRHCDPSQTQQQEKSKKPEM